MRFGALGTVLSGDFLQLPPVERASPARPISSTGFLMGDLDIGAVEGAEDLGKKAKALGESRQGRDL